MAVLSDYFDIELQSLPTGTDGSAEIYYNKIIMVSNYTDESASSYDSILVKLIPKNFNSLQAECLFDTTGLLYNGGAYRSGISINRNATDHIHFTGMVNCNTYSSGAILQYLNNSGSFTLKYDDLYTRYYPYIDLEVNNSLQFPVVQTLTVQKLYINGVEVPIDTPPTDPYAGAGDSTTDGGDGTFDGSSDPVPVPSLPSMGATDTGFITLFVPTRAQLKQVAEYMWGGLFDVSTWKRLFEDPMDCILGLSVVPVTVPATASGNITVGNIELSGISLPIADQQYVEVDCGTIDFSNRYFGSYLDFEPYTKMSLFVPYSGVHSVSADDIIGKIVGLKYHIDILTGSLVAFLTCGDSVLYEFNGACASNIPVNSMNYASTIENAIRIAVNIGTTVATAGASAPVQGISQAQQTARNIGTGISLAGSTTEGALSLKPNIDRAGSLGGTTGLMGNQTPYFIITRPRLCKPKNQDFFQGYPSFIQTTIGDLIGKGFTSFTNIIIAESFMTDAENEELETILQGGVYL